jgi:N utilization substance protein B
LRDFVREAENYARELIEGVVSHLGEIDALIEEAARNWSVSRMSTTDRNILRVATCEMVFRSDVPFRVAINEALELAKRFGSPKFPAFANGVLDRIRSGRD